MKKSNRNKPKYGCPVEATIHLLAGKWKVQILWHLSFGPRRFAELRDLLPGLTEKVLTEQLRQLQRDGVLGRTASSSVPPKVTYSLNSAGKRLIDLMEGLCDWGSEHFGIEPTLRRAS
jgi:DNA-binding HxlR family transcriptional regulator